MILVVGATGLVGNEVCQRLRKQGEQVRALVRKTSAPEKIAALTGAGVDLYFGDLKDPDSLAHACRGVDAVISTASSTFSRQQGDSIESVDKNGQLHLAEAIRAAKVRRFIFVSFRPPQDLSFPLGDAKAQVEHAISDLNFTIIQASWFMEVWLSPALGFDYVNATARIYGPGTSPVSWVSFRDVAEMCVLSLSHPGAERRTIGFGGPKALTPLEVVSRFEQIGGRPFHVEHVPEEGLRAHFDAATDPLEKSFGALMLAYVHGDEIAMAPIEQEFGIKLTSVEDYAHQVTAT